MTTQADTDFAQWKTLHQAQLTSIQLPETLHRKLFQKLMFEDLDLAHAVKIIRNQDDDNVDLMAIKALPKESDVFLIDHAWTFQHQDAFDTLIKNPALV